MEQALPVVGVIMGSVSDMETMRHGAATLEALQIPHEVRIISAHRTPDMVGTYAAAARERGIRVIIAGAGGAAHLPGMTAAHADSVPVIGVPVPSGHLHGHDALLSIVQMPGGTPVNTMAIGRAGAINAALSAAEMLAITDEAVLVRLRAFRQRLRDKVEQDDGELRTN